jgi:hypothetical protein
VCPTYWRRRPDHHRPLTQLLKCGAGQSHEYWQVDQDIQHVHRCIALRLLRVLRHPRPLLVVWSYRLFRCRCHVGFYVARHSRVWYSSLRRPSTQILELRIFEVIVSCGSIECFVRLGRGRWRRKWNLCVEEEQVGLCEPARNDEDPSSFVGIL